MKHQRKKQTREILNAFTLLSQIGISMIVPILFSIWFGNFLDKKFETGVTFLAIFAVLGVMTSFKVLYDMVIKRFM